MSFKSSVLSRGLGKQFLLLLFAIYYIPLPHREWYPNGGRSFFHTKIYTHTHTHPGGVVEINISPRRMICEDCCMPAYICCEQQRQFISHAPSNASVFHVITLETKLFFSVLQEKDKLFDCREQHDSIIPRLYHSKYSFTPFSLSLRKLVLSLCAILSSFISRVEILNRWLWWLIDTILSFGLSFFF